MKLIHSIKKLLPFMVFDFLTRLGYTLHNEAYARLGPRSANPLLIPHVVRANPRFNQFAIVVHPPLISFKPLTLKNHFGSWESKSFLHLQIEHCVWLFSLLLHLVRNGLAADRGIRFLHNLIPEYIFHRQARNAARSRRNHLPRPCWQFVGLF